jgi:hypothetical protein
MRRLIRSIWKRARANGELRSLNGSASGSALPGSQAQASFFRPDFFMDDT